MLERVQRRATKWVLGLHGLDYVDRLNVLGLQMLSTRRSRQDLIVMYKLMHGHFYFDWRRFFDPVACERTRGHPLKVRSKYIPRHDFAKNLFAFRVVSPWNQLPTEVAMAPSINTFKKRLHATGSIPAI